MNKLTIFTPTYNRGYIIKDLFESLLEQTCHDFIWLVIDDGSSDDTPEIFAEIQCKSLPFPVRYIQIENGGKQRAVNHAASIIDTEYTFIVDSDDILTPDAVGKIIKWINDDTLTDKHAGVSGLKAAEDGKKLAGEPLFEGEYVDCSNLDRRKYNLQADMAEVYRTDILRKYPFNVYENEKFVPEALVWDAIAKDGYVLRWYNEVIYLCSYRQDGLTRGFWKLLKNNPVGFARLYAHNAEISGPFSYRIRSLIQMDACLLLAKKISLIREASDPLAGFLLLPAGFLLYLRRRGQIKHFGNN